jgi:hypothetical protein
MATPSGMDLNVRNYFKVLSYAPWKAKEGQRLKALGISALTLFIAPLFCALVAGGRAVFKALFGRGKLIQESEAGVKKTAEAVEQAIGKSIKPIRVKGLVKVLSNHSLVLQLHFRDEAQADAALKQLKSHLRSGNEQKKTTGSKENNDLVVIQYVEIKANSHLEEDAFVARLQKGIELERQEFPPDMSPIVIPALQKVVFDKRGMAGLSFPDKESMEQAIVVLKEKAILRNVVQRYVPNADKTNYTLAITLKGTLEDQETLVQRMQKGI